jgi:hypothetical protein
MLVGQIRTSLREYGTSHDTSARNLVTPRLLPFDLSDPDLQLRIKVLEAREWAVAAMNLPGGLPDMTYAIFSPAHIEWTPRGMIMGTWRDLSWPIIGIFFWWLAGRSIEALFFSRHKILLPKIRWWEVVVSVPVLALGAILAVGLCIDRSSHTELPFWMLLAIFGGMWLLLGASTSLAYLIQRRLRGRLSSGTVEQVPLRASASLKDP